MRRLAALLLVTSLVPASCFADPHHWYKDWKTLAGLGVIAGSLVADGRSSCVGYSRGLVERNFLDHGSRSCGHAVAILAVGGVVYGGLHIWEHRLNENEPSRAWRMLGYVSVPAVACGFHCTAAALNYEKLPPR